MNWHHRKFNLHKGRYTQAYAVLREMIRRGVIEDAADDTFRITERGREVAQKSIEEQQT